MASTFKNRRPTERVVRENCNDRAGLGGADRARRAWNRRGRVARGAYLPVAVGLLRAETAEEGTEESSSARSSPNRSHSRAPEAGGSRARVVSRRLQVCALGHLRHHGRAPRLRVHPGDGRDFVLVLILRPHRPAPALGGGSGRARSVSRQPVGIVIVRVQGSAHVQLSVRRLRGRHLRHRDGRFRRTCRHRPPATPRTVVAPRVELVELSADEFLMANNRLRC